jgi:hypothetical protein
MLDVVAGMVRSCSLDCVDGNVLSGGGEGAFGFGEPSVVDYSTFVDLGLGHKVPLCLRYRQVPLAGRGLGIGDTDSLVQASLVRPKRWLPTSAGAAQRTSQSWRADGLKIFKIRTKP